MKKLMLILFCTSILVSCEDRKTALSTEPKPTRPFVTIAPKPELKHDSILIAAVGDIMLGTSYPDSSRLPADSAKGSFKSVQHQFKNADIVFGNLEGALLDSGMPDGNKKKLATAFLFRMPAVYGQVLKSAGFNLLSVANNHITDFGNAGCRSTAHTLDALGIHYAGLEQYPTAIFEQNGVTYGFCSFAPNAKTVQLLDFRNAAEIIGSLKKTCDIVIVSFHGGAEGAAFEHVTFTNESYMGAKRGDVHAFAHNAIDAGADLVLGNGPHVNRAMECYKNRLIAYSLGNFCTYKSVSVMGVCGLAPLLKVYINKKGEFLSGQIVSYKQTHEKGLIPDNLNEAANRIKMLTETDFPNSGLQITDDGKITPALPSLAENQ